MAESILKKNFSGSTFMSWLLGSIFAISGVSTITSSLIGGLFFIIAGIIVVPPVKKLFKSKLNKNLSNSAAFTTSILLGFIALAIVAPPSETSSVQNTAHNEAQEKTNRCLDVPSELLSWVEGGLITDSLYLENAKAVKSNDFEEVYFVSAYLKGENVSGESIATFAVNNLEGSGLVLSISGHAKEFTDWFHGDREGAQYHVTMGHDGARESRDCVEKP